VKQCLVVRGVAKETNLGEILKESGTINNCQVLRCEPIQGAEADTNLEKWILQFESSTSRAFFTIVILRHNVCLTCT